MALARRCCSIRWQIRAFGYVSNSLRTLAGLHIEIKDDSLTELLDSGAEQPRIEPPSKTRRPLVGDLRLLSLGAGGAF